MFLLFLHSLSHKFFNIFFSLTVIAYDSAIPKKEPGWLNELGSWIDYLTIHTSLSPIRCGFAPGFVNYKKRCTRLTVASDKVYQLLAHGRWFSPGTPASSTTTTGRHDIAELNIAERGVKTQKIKNKIKIIKNDC